jgi:hypothetical protein
MSLDQKHNPESLDTEPVRSLLPPLQFDPRQMDDDEYLSERFARSLTEAAETALKINTDRVQPLPEEVVLAAVKAAFSQRVERSIAAADRFYTATRTSERGKRIHGKHDFMSFGTAAKHFIDNPWLDEMDLGGQVYDTATPGLSESIIGQLRTYFLTIRDIADEKLRHEVDCREMSDYAGYKIVTTNEFVAHSKSGAYHMIGERVWVHQDQLTSDGTIQTLSTPIMESISVQRTDLHDRRMKRMHDIEERPNFSFDLEDVLED